METDPIEGSMKASVSPHLESSSSPSSITEFNQGEVMPQGTETWEPNEILVVGGGALGSLFAGRLSREAERGNEAMGGRSPKDKELHVRLVGRGSHYEAIQERGGLEVRTVSGQGSYLCRPVLGEPKEGEEMVDLAIIAVKGKDTLTAAETVRKYLKPGGYVLSLQNGDNSEVLRSVFDPARLIMSTTTQAANLDGPHGMVRWNTAL